MRFAVAKRNLVFSQAIIILFLIFTYFTWFPNSFAELGGFYRTSFMLIFADLILGPLLVFIVFKEGKKYLKFDINVLLSIQIGAFLFGAYSLFLKHPTHAVFDGKQFTVVNVSQLFPIQPLSEQLKAYFFTSPKIVISQHPKDIQANMELALAVDFSGEPDIDRRPEYFQPLNQQLKMVFDKSIPKEILYENTQANHLLNLFLEKHGGTVDDYAFLPLRGNNKKEAIWAFKRSNGMPVGIIKLLPKITVALNL